MNKIDLPPVRAGRATMTDVSKRAGVSMKSVSRVINGEPNVSVKLRTKVESAIAALNYVPDPAARALAGARSFTIGIMFDNPSPNYTMKVMAGAYRACVEHSYHLRVVNLDTQAPRAQLVAQIEKILRHSRADGFVLTPPVCDNTVVLDILEQHQIRYSRIAPVLDPGRSGAVRIDDRSAAAQVVDLFWKLGHRRFGLVNGPAEHGASKTRRAGYLGRIDELFPGAIVSEATGGFSFDGGINAGRELLGARKPPTAIFAANDDMAAGVMVACAEHGLKVPGDISICGFDDSWVALSVWPPLTTVYQPIEEMAHAAALMMLERSPADAAMPQRLLDYHLIERGSVAPTK